MVHLFVCQAKLCIPFHVYYKHNLVLKIAFNAEAINLKAKMEIEKVFLTPIL
jgi:hypothetical protein